MTFSTKMIVNDKTVLIFSNNSNCNLYVGAQANSLFIKHYLYSYNNQVGHFTFKQIVVKYNLVNHLLADSIIISHSLMNKDSLTGTSNYFYTIQPSTDGKYLTCNDDGDILSLADNSSHSVKSGNFSKMIVAYSNSGPYLLVTPANSNNNKSDLIEIYSLPNFSLVKRLKSPNPVNIQGSISMGEK